MVEIILGISGQVPSGKNQINLAVRGGRIVKYPNDRFVAWRTSFEIQARGQTKARGIAEKVTANILVRQGDKIRRDVPGQLDAIWHALHRCGILVDDYWIRSVTFDEVLDRENPGAVIRLTYLGASL